MKPEKGQTVYNLIHSQQMVQFMWRYSLHMQSTQIPFAIAFDEDLDFKILARAVNTEIERNDCMRLRVFRDGFKIRQFFLDEYKLEKILIKDFRSKDEQTDFFDKDAEKKLDIFSGETFRIIFFRDFEGKCGVYLKVSHMIMDFVAVFLFFKDLMAVYDSMKNGTALPKPLAKYEDIIKKELADEGLELRIQKDIDALSERVMLDRRPSYNGITGQSLLERQRRLLMNKKLDTPHAYLPVKDRTHLVKCRLSDEDSIKISDFIKENNLSAECVIQLAFRIYLSKINGHTNDSLFWVLCPKRKTVKEKRCGGTLASPLPWREILNDSDSFIDASRQLRETQSFLFRHSEVPFTAVRQMERDKFGYALMQSANDMMFSYLPTSGENSFGDRNYEFTAYNFGHYVMPVYALAMQDPCSGRYSFSYIHRLWVTEDEDVCRFHDGVVRTLVEGVTRPEKTIAEIMEVI